MRGMLSFCWFVIALFLCLSVRAEDNDPVDAGRQLGISAGFLWESKYVTEGRNNVEDGGIWSTELVGEYADFFLGVWYAYGDSEDYDEVNIFGGYEFEVGSFESYLAYTRLQFPEESESDNEFSAGTSYVTFPYLIPGIDYVYSTEAEGCFVEVWIRSDVPLFDKRVVVSPYIMEGFDFGYATDEFDGPNNFQVGIEATISMAEHVELMGYVARSWAHEDVEREGLGDLSWGGVGIVFTF